MQKLIAKYGLAAHLALLAVAPLFLFPFCDASSIAWALIWLTLPAAIWVVLGPSVRTDEHLHDARRRVAEVIFRDPLFWASLAMVAFTGIRALNTGIEVCYNAETSAWRVSGPLFPILPGVVGAAGDLPFAASLACMVLMQGCLHSLGRSARMAFLLLSSFLSGLAACVALFAFHQGVPGAMRLLPAADGLLCSYVGLALGLHLIGGLISLSSVVELRWKKSFPLLFAAVGGNAAGLFVFAPPYLSVALAAAGALVLAYATVFSCIVSKGTSGLKLLVFGGISLSVGGLLVVAVLPSAVLDGRLAAIAGLDLFPERYWEFRQTLSSVAFKSWLSHIWAGTGVASFPLDFRFAAQAGDWEVLPRGATMVPNGWWLLLTECGIVGTVFFILPYGFLLLAYVRRMFSGEWEWALPHPVCLIAPTAFLLLAASGFFDCSSLRAEVLTATCAFMAVSAAAIQRTRGGQNG